MRYVDHFAEGDKDKKDLLGGKGANLSEMIKIGRNVPPGFTVTTEPAGLTVRWRRPRRWPSRSPSSWPASRRRSDARWVIRRTRCSSRALGAVLDARNDGDRPQYRPERRQRGRTARKANDDHFAWDSYRRLIQMFGKTVLNLPGEDFEHALDQMKQVTGVTTDVELDGRVASPTGGRLQVDRPRWHAAMSSRRIRTSSSTSRSGPSSIPGTPTARGSTVARSASRTRSAPPSTCRQWPSATQVRDPGRVSRSRVTRVGGADVYGDYLPDAQGEDVVAGIRNALPLQSLEALDKSPTS